MQNRIFVSSQPTFTQNFLEVSFQFILSLRDFAYVDDSVKAGLKERESLQLLLTMLVVLAVALS